MALFQPLTEFYSAISDDARISTTHISIYMAFLQQWNMSGGKSPIEVSRETIMKSAKINARYTYYRRVKELQDYGYISYFPAAGSCGFSKVVLNSL
jgi:hypothetical protein